MGYFCFKASLCVCDFADQNSMFRCINLGFCINAFKEMNITLDLWALLLIIKPIMSRQQAHYTKGSALS